MQSPEEFASIRARYRDEADESAALIADLLSEVRTSLSASDKILDFGCGRGRLVVALRALGYSVDGTDFTAAIDEADDGVDGLRAIEERPYHLPFPDNHFDAVVSVAVFEHVFDYQQALKEIHRVLKPGAVTVNIFSARYRLIEPHIAVPLASFIRWRWWIMLWSRLGVRPWGQPLRAWRERYEMSCSRSLPETNYLTGRAIRREFVSVFDACEFAEGPYLTLKSASGRRGGLRRVIASVPGGAWLFRTFWTRVVVATKR